MVIANTPLVSIIVPCFNHEKYIEECIESIINQSYLNFELIVIDDGSTDNSNIVISKLLEQYQFTFISQNNSGISKTINYALTNHCIGKYVTICASDDFWPKDKLEIQVSFMENNLFFPMSYGKTHYVDENSNIINEFDCNNSNLRGGDIFESIFTFKLHPPVNYMFHKSIFTELGLYPDGCLAEDYYMNLKISSKYKIGYIDSYLSYYRIIGTSVKVERTEALSISYLDTINGFENLKFKSFAIRQLYLRKYTSYSSFKKFKLKAIVLLPRLVPFYFNKSFIVGTYNLFFKWD
jgi:alpha-1,3-rhamnosyltransferase